MNDLSKAEHEAYEAAKAKAHRNFWLVIGILGLIAASLRPLLGHSG